MVAGVGAFVAERAGWFDPAGWRDAVPGLGAPSTTPPETAAPAGSDAQSGDQAGDQSGDQSADQFGDDAAPPPEGRPPETAVVRPERKPAPDAVAPARKPTSDRLARDGTADDTPADGNDGQTAAAQPASDAADGSSGRTASTGAKSSLSDRAETARTDAGSQPPADETDRAAPAGSATDASPRGQTQAGTQRAAQPAGQTGTAPASEIGQPGTGQPGTGQPGTGPTDTGEAPAPGDPDSGMQLTVPARDGEAEAPQGAEVAEVPARQLPSFDIVRVERSGEAVIAGRAAPRSRVTVLQDDQPIATAEADARGEFVAIPHRPLPPGQRQLTLRAEDPESGETAESDRAVVIDIPRMPEDDTAPAAAASRTPEAAAETAGPQIATRGDSDADADSAGDRQSGPSDTARKQTAGSAGPETREDGGAGKTAKGADTPGPVAVRDNRPTAEPPLLADRSGEADSASDTLAGADARGQGEAVTVPAPPDASAEDPAPAATVTDVPEPAGGGAAVTAQSVETGGDAGARVTTRQENTGAGEGADRIATRAMRPRAAAPAQGGAGTRSDSAPDSTSDSAIGGRGDAPIAVLVPREGTGEVEVLQRPSGETGLADRALVLEAVQYTVDGGISISGRAPARALIVAYLNESELARTRAPADGDWTMAPEADVPPGLHTLRVDQLGPDGQVRASVSTPFANQPMVDDLDENEGMVVIQPGDNLWTIARRTYGQGWEYTVIYRANRDQIRDPDLIYPGQVFVVPEEQRRDTGSAE